MGEVSYWRIAAHVLTACAVVIRVVGLMLPSGPGSLLWAAVAGCLMLAGFLGDSIADEESDND